MSSDVPTGEAGGRHGSARVGGTDPTAGHVPSCSLDNALDRLHHSAGAEIVFENRGSTRNVAERFKLTVDRFFCRTLDWTRCIVTNRPPYLTARHVQ